MGAGRVCESGTKKWWSGEEEREEEERRRGKGGETVSGAKPRRNFLKVHFTPFADLVGDSRLRF